MNTLTFQKNDVIFLEDDFADSMYKLLSGTVRIVFGYGTENENEIAVMKAGDYFGEMGLMECYPRSATAVVSSDTAEMIEFGIADCQHFFKEDPDAVMKILLQLAARIQDTDRMYLEAAETVQKAKAAQAKNEEQSEESKISLRRLRNYYFSFVGR